MPTVPTKSSTPSSSVPQTPGEIDPKTALKAVCDVAGAHPGCRPAHARGTICSGTFTALEHARAITAAAQMKGAPVDAIVRFSNASGDPGVPDGEPDVRGMAVRLEVPDDAAGGAPIDIVSVTMPCFFVNTPRDFVAFNRCFKNGGPGRKPKPRLKLLPFLVRHPEALRPFVGAMFVKPVPSYANCSYGALHAYRWIDDLNKVSNVRYWWVPEEGEISLGRRAARARPPDFLQRDLIERLGRQPPKPIRFQLHVEFAGDDDDPKVNKPATRWKGSRTCVGLLEVTGLAEADVIDEPLVFDPARVTAGIELSDDQILRFRPRVYELSAKFRAAGKTR